MLGGMRVGGVYRMFGGQQQNVGAAGAGEIVALGRLEGARTGQTLANGAGPAPVELPQPPAARADVRLRGHGRQPQRRGQAVGGVRQAHRRGSGAAVRARPGDPPDLALGPGRDPPARRPRPAEHQVQCRGRAAPAAASPYRETIRKGTQAHGRHKKQSRRAWPVRRRQDRDHARWRAAKASSSRTRSWAARCRASSSRRSRPAPASFCSAARWAFRWSMSRVTLYDGQFHSVDSNEIAFKLATALALKEGLQSCDPGAARADLGGRPISVPSDYTSRALQLVIQQARPDPGLRGQGGLERLGRDLAPAFRRARCTT